ncbi:serine hydrolase FSH [Aspergillus candidus]|uniref:Serine hydrolase FSH n=1 Tax=Aspergillus candidus TaxID=41067 RepID=A0A2I2F9H1_ASPCN|nr:serine hydrolase FSH [Aspergillus candidus]PLB37284.1 serine hydrolase FSH [Aspergillus candidus]
MRFLCLHGAGTSAEIFEIQSGGLTQALETEGHVFKYIDGRLEADPEPEIKGICDGPFYDHYPRGTSPGEDLIRAINYTMNIIHREGPFDAVLSFSQGAALAAATILHHARANPSAPPLFKLAVFICGAAPYTLDGKEILDRAPDAPYPLTVPTVHIVGRQDTLYPWSMRLYGLCDPARAELYDHGSKHHIPFDVRNTEAMLGVIERGIERAG